MRFIKNFFHTVSNFLAHRITYCIDKFVELTAPVFSYVFCDSKVVPTGKQWVKCVGGVLIMAGLCAFSAAFSILLTTGITYALSFALPLIAANIIALVATIFYVHYLLDVADSISTPAAEMAVNLAEESEVSAAEPAAA